ncbi:MAG: hypothetical protein AAGD38_17455 [Acidobacteriota bacterium]
MYPIRSTSLATLVLVALLLVPAAIRAAEQPETSRIQLTTHVGTIEIELNPAAAPDAVERLLTLARNAPATSFALEDAKPYSLVASSPIEALEGTAIEIDATRLGLDRDRIANLGEAMDVVQFEVMPIHQRDKQRPPTPTFGEWIATWRDGRDPSFLVGVSRQELYEGFGYVYRTGLDSQPVHRGAVLLRPATPETASPRLIFSVADRPTKTGRWMVIGHVTRGLELLDRLSIAPLDDASAKSGRMADPVVIESIEIAR